MGADCSCQRVECEEEVFTRIFSSMILMEIECKSAYSEFSKCIHKQDGYLDYFLFKNFLAKIVGENNYKKAQICYFENLRKMDNKKQNMKRIGALMIFLSKGTKYQKEELLYEHYMKFYITVDERSVKEFITDMIEVHTDNCLQSFRENLDYDSVKNMNEIYKKMRKRQLLYHIYSNFERVRIKYFHRTPSVVALKSLRKDDILNNSLDIENINLNDVAMIEDPSCKKQAKEDIFEAYERYSKNQCDPFYNHFALESSKLNQEEKIVKEFIELSFNYFTGEYMRNWLYEDYMKEKTYVNVCI
jgi:hypothetical protein